MWMPRTGVQKIGASHSDATFVWKRGAWVRETVVLGDERVGSEPEEEEVNWRRSARG